VPHLLIVGAGPGIAARALAPEGVHVATATIRGLVGEDGRSGPIRCD
jgi:hypothetical protein